MVISTILFDKPAFKNLVCNGMVLAEDGKKMSKSLKNYPVRLILKLLYSFTKAFYSLFNGDASFASLRLGEISTTCSTFFAHCERKIVDRLCHAGVDTSTD